MWCSAGLGTSPSGGYGFGVRCAQPWSNNSVQALSLPFVVAPTAPRQVPADWALTPDGLSAGDEFRLLFLTSTKRDATSSDIDDYNTFVQTAAAAGHAAVQDYSDGFYAVASTADDDARDNTETTYTASDKGVPIYWLGATSWPTTTRTSTTGPGTRRQIRPTSRAGERQVKRHGPAA